MSEHYIKDLCELPAALGAEAELGRLIEPMFPPRLLLEKPLDEVEEEDLPPSTESSSSKFLSAQERCNIEPHVITTSPFTINLHIQMYSDDKLENFIHDLIHFVKNN